jgi:fumarate reductase subunit C
VNPAAYILQRGTAMLMAPLVLVHLVTIILAVRGGLSADDILARTQGSLFWGGFYTLFVLAAVIHAGIGLQVIAREWGRLSQASAGIIAAAFMAVTVVLGLRAVYAVVAA